MCGKMTEAAVAAAAAVVAPLFFLTLPFALAAGRSRQTALTDLKQKPPLPRNRGRHAGTCSAAEL